jgi:ubiquinone/menaquinone biosynthesis C-methylase UbiE
MSGGAASADPFDGAARSYDESFTRTALGRELRTIVWREMEGVFNAGQRVLELGCGTGEDALWMARRGVEVVATDGSATMLEVTRHKVGAAGQGSMVQTRQLHLDRMAEHLPALDGPFDGALSNFGPLNCLEDRTELARALAKLVRPGGTVVVVLMGPFCPWEILWHLAHLKPAMAVRRLRQGRPVAVGEGAAVRVWYPSPGTVRRAFSEGFSARGPIAVGCFLPPPYLAHLEHTRPRLILRLRQWERRWHRRFPMTWCGDHYLMSFRRRE